MRALLTIAALLPLAGCGKPRLYADGAWVRLAAVPGAPAAAYLTVHGGDRTSRVTGIDSTAAAHAEMHETVTMTAGGGAGMTAMKPLASVTVPAGGEVRFAPGGRHIMLFGIQPGVKPGDALTLTLHVAGTPDQRAEAKVVAAGDPPPR